MTTRQERLHMSLAMSRISCTQASPSRSEIGERAGFDYVESRRPAASLIDLMGKE